MSKEKADKFIYPGHASMPRYGLPSSKDTTMGVYSGVSRRDVVKMGAALLLLGGCSSSKMIPGLASSRDTSGIRVGATSQRPFDALGSSHGRFSWSNPISQGIPGGIRDAQVFWGEGRWRMIGGMPPFWEGDTPGVRLLSSDDLHTWGDSTMLIERDNLSPETWYRDRFWAPEIHHINGYWYLTVNCRNEEFKKSKGAYESHGGLVAVAKNVEGPYQVITKEKPLMVGNDLSFFEDDDGQVYAFWNTRPAPTKIKGARLKISPESAQLVGEHVECIDTGHPGQWDSAGIEGPFIIKRNGIYYMFYSSWSRGYEIGYATASSPLGPWRKHHKNPVYGGQDEAVCKKFGLPFTGDPDQPFKAVGHNGVFIGPDGGLWVSCHGILKENATQSGDLPLLVIDPIHFNNANEIVIDGPSYDPKEVVW